MPSLFVGLASNDDPTTHKARECILRAQRECAFPITGAVVEGDGVARARNNLAAKFLDSECTHLLFQDADILTQPEHYTRLLSHNLPIVAGLYAKKQPRLSWVASALPGEEVDPATGLQRVQEVGTGFLCIEREVFIRMIAAHPEIKYFGDPGPEDVRWDFFPMHAAGGRYLSEDWYFCHRAREIGYAIHVDWRVRVRHRGMIDYPLHESLSALEFADLCHQRTGKSIESIAAFFSAP